MKPILYILFILFAHAAYAQTVPSSCTAPDSIVKKYTDDADYTTLAYLYYINSPYYTDSSMIPRSMSDTVLRAMIAVYNATTLPARDSVVTIYHVHNYRISELKTTEIIADVNAGFIVQIKNGNIPTGYVPFDNLMSKYHLHVASQGNTPGLGGSYSVHFVSDSNYNMVAVDSEFIKLNIYAHLEPITGDGGDILVDSIIGDNVYLTYSFGWGDCPSGCNWRHDWHFSIDKDCGVTYKGSSGDPVPPASVNDIRKTRIHMYPNPVSDILHIENVHAINYSIYNIWGQTVNSGLTNGDISVEQLPVGSYFIQLKNNNVNATSKFIKE